MQPNAVNKIIMSAVCLHNFLKSFEEQQLETDRCYCPPRFVDIENNNGNIINGGEKTMYFQVFYRLMLIERQLKRMKSEISLPTIF